MSRPNSDTRNRIRGPQSALTDFLAANNISAREISASYQRRLTDAQQNAGQQDHGADQEDNDENEDGDNNNEDEKEDDDEAEDPAEKKKRKRKEEKLLHKIKQTKEFKRRKYETRRKGGGGGDGDGDDDDDDDDEGSSDDSNSDADNALARRMMRTNKKAKKKPVRLPGQLDNCELCGKRFTVTPYSKAGPNSGLLCPKCSKEAKDEEKARQKKSAAAASDKRASARSRRRQLESNRLMGDVQPGAKSLVECCVRKVADLANDIQDFGDMPQRVLDRLSMILSKKRLLTSRTLSLFLRPDSNSINVYDCGKLEEDDFQRIFAHMPNLSKVNLRFAGQMRDNALIYMTDKCTRLRHLQLGATNLISNLGWEHLLVHCGAQLRSLKLSELNDSLDCRTTLLLAQHCTQLRRLKLRSCPHLTSDSIAALASLTQLEHLTLSVATGTTQADTLSQLIASIGPSLRTLCLESFEHLDNTTLTAIHTHCRRLSKLRITGSTLCTDAGFAALFTSWPNSALSYLDLSSNRDLNEVRADSQNATSAAQNQDDYQDPDDAAAAAAQAAKNTTGLGSAALIALMRHSGTALQHLDLHSNRYISLNALLDAFDPKQAQNQYPNLKDIDLSFVSTVDDVVMRSIFRCCPKLEKLALFACFNARGGVATIPRGVAVIGLPNAHDNIVQGDNLAL